MITNTDLSTLQLSPTNKDYYQIWNELLETAGKLSERWDPTSTNESDPGIVLLKVLTALGDKLNYNTDKNILEAFMPTAAQRESMQKLCDMMGYDMKYYRSATTNVTVSFVGDQEVGSAFDSGSTKLLPRFTPITDTDGILTYATTEDVIINSTTDAVIPVIEGSIIRCQTDNSNIITARHLDTNNRYYLPESQIAENGIFIYNITTTGDIASDRWLAVQTLNLDIDQADNLAIRSLSSIQAGVKAYKFGYDSKVNLPYIQFPADIANLIQDGLAIYYTRTSGANGNISARTLNTITLPSEWTTSSSETDSVVAAEDFYVNNTEAARNGADPETIDSAYENFKKTVGTFDTLVTCRDYMNYLYNATMPESTNPIVSNIVVSDIRSDINSAIKICEFSNFLMDYQDYSLTTSDESQKTVDRIDHFDLVLYPLNSVYGRNTYEEYKKSFDYSTSNYLELMSALASAKTISHDMKLPIGGDIVSIKNYLKLRVRISTVAKVNTAEEKEIISKIKTALYANFNARKLDFGEEIPFDYLQKVIQNADTRIKNVSMEEPELTPKVAYLNDLGNLLERSALPQTPSGGPEKSIQENVNKLYLRNILAGRAPLFDYDTTFESNFNEINYEFNGSSSGQSNQTIISAYAIKGSCDITGENKDGTIYFGNASSEKPDDGLVLTTNEVVTFRAPNLVTTVTYPAYTYYSYRGADIEADVDYELKEGQTLVMNYTKNDSGKQVTETYKAGDIIKPNFKLVDTGKIETVRRSGRTYTVLGSSEQIEIREINKINLTTADGQLNLYWILNNGRRQLLPAAAEGEPVSYTLQDGEYLFYTDAAQKDIAYYGSGTEIKYTPASTDDKQAFILSVDTEQIGIETILEGGAGDVPWQYYNITPEASLEIIEYQYIALGESDTLNSIIVGDSTDTIRSNNWYKIFQANFQLAGENEAESLPNREIGASNSKNWEVRTGLILFAGPKATQYLRDNRVEGKGALDRIQIYNKFDDYTKQPDTSSVYKLTGNLGGTVGFKSSQLLWLTSTDWLNIYSYDENKDTYIPVYLKAVEDSPASLSYMTSSGDSETLSLQLHSASRIWTSISGSAVLSANNFGKLQKATLNISIQRTDKESDKTKRCFGLMMIYITEPVKLNAVPGCLSLYNRSDIKQDLSGNLFLTKDPELEYTTYILKILPDCTSINMMPDITAGDYPYDNLKIVISDLDIIKCNAKNKDDEVEIVSCKKIEANHEEIEATKYYDLPNTIEGTGIQQYNNLSAENPNLFSVEFNKYIKISPPITPDNYDLYYYQQDASGVNTKIFNPMLATDEEEAYEFNKAILDQLKTLDPNYKFYYNCLIDNATALDIDYYSDDQKESLSSPRTWYDYNNMNNHFVISEIDVANSDIQIAKSSKLNTYNNY